MQTFNLKRTSDQKKWDQFLAKRGSDFSKVGARIDEVIQAVRRRGDSAILAYTERFDKVKLKKNDLLVPKSELKRAYNRISPSLKQALNLAKGNIVRFYSQTKRSSWSQTNCFGAKVGEIRRPLDKVGVYVPGGSAPLVSTILMTVLPAKVAGVKKIIAVTPPNKKGEIQSEMLAAFYAAGVDAVYRVGGAQAIAALAYGTQSIPKVDKIVGPGNIYVTAAKKRVYGDVGIDTLAGPSEVLIVADKSANPEFVAADMLSQLEHDPKSEAILVSRESKIISETKSALQIQMKQLNRQKQLIASSGKGAVFVLVSSLKEAVQAANLYAPEHCEVVVKQAGSLAKEIKTAGALFLGNYTPVATGDFVAGPSHVLPTGGAGRFSSGLSLDDFMKKTSLISFSRNALAKSRKAIQTFTDVEGLDAHKASVDIRFKD